MDAPTPHTSPRGSNLWLLASAMVLGGLIVVQLGRLTGTPAYGDLVNQGNDLGIATVTALNDDLVVVLDQRTEELLVYAPANNQRSVEFKSRHSLKELFLTARASTPVQGEREKLPPSPVRENPPR